MKSLVYLLAALILAGCVDGVGSLFQDEFDGVEIALDPAGIDGWTYFSGDGEAEIELMPGDGFGSIYVDARRDTHNVWWALIKRSVNEAIDMQRLAQAGWELRVEARVRTNTAPRRINLHVNTGRTVDFHSHLMEYDLPDTVGWHTISMTTREFDARREDTVFVQLALMDWGTEVYRLDIDYLRVDVVRSDAGVPDLGEPVPYGAPPPNPEDFATRIVLDEVIVVSPPGAERFVVPRDAGPARALQRTFPVDTVRWVVLPVAIERSPAVDTLAAMLELHLTGSSRTRPALQELGQVRIAEVFGTLQEWGAEVAEKSWASPAGLTHFVNPQMIVDVRPEVAPDGPIRVPIPAPVVRRLRRGDTAGFAFRALGHVDANVRAHPEGGVAVLHLGAR